MTGEQKPRQSISRSEANVAETQTFQPGDVVRYTPGNNGWCRHGIAVIQDGGAGRDTYWSSGDGSYVSPERLEDAELMFHMPDYRQVEHRSEWEKYAEKDRQSFPMGAYPVRLFVRSAAEPDLETQIANARQVLADAEAALESAGRKIRWATEDLVKLELKRA